MPPLWPEAAVEVAAASDSVAVAVSLAEAASVSVAVAVSVAVSLLGVGLVDVHLHVALAVRIALGVDKVERIGALPFGRLLLLHIDFGCHLVQEVLDFLCSLAGHFVVGCAGRC